MNCEAKSCRITKDVTFIMERNSKRPQISIKHYYCPFHLRRRAFQLELLKLSGEIQAEIRGWK